MKKISIIILLMICMSMLLLTGCFGVTPKIDSENLEYQGDTNDTETVDTGGGTVATEGAETVDTGGGTVATEGAGTVEADTTKPVITGSRAPLPNSFGWNNTDVTVSFSCADTGPVQSGIEINTVAGETVTTEGKNQSVTNTGVCIDVAGNVADSVTVSNINIDKTPPVVTITLPKNGKYGLNESVTATWSATDDLSGVEDSKAKKTIKIDTKSKGKKKITLPWGLVKDEAGNSSEEVTISYEVIESDTTKPVITGSRAPLPNSFGWNNTDVTVSFSCADTGPVQSGIEINTVAGETVTTEGKNQSVTNTGVCTDAAGNTADPVTVSNINIDKTPPEVTITLPGTGEYALNQSITATWSATDALSGVVSPVSGTVSIDTSSVGTKTFTLPAGTATDKAGNSSLIVTKSYSVIADTEDPEMIYPQKWATGDGTAENPWANDCIKEALTNCPVGGTIFLKAGYYILSDKVDVRKKVNIIGEGRNKTIIITADAHGLHINGVDYVTIKNLTVDGDAQIITEEDYRGCIVVGQCSYALLENIEVKNGGDFGIDTNTMNHSSLLNIYAHDNGSHGIHSGTDISGNNAHNTYRDIYSWDNAKGGFDDRGNGTFTDEDLYNLYDNLQCWDNGTHGISINGQHNATLSNSSVSGSGIKGLYLYDIEDCNFHDCYVELSDEQGIYLQNSDNNNFTDVIVKNNNAVNGSISGITVRESNGTRFTSCQSYDDRDTPLQRYGIHTEDSVDYVNLVNCILLPNLKGAIVNYAEAEIIDGMKLASL